MNNEENKITFEEFVNDNTLLKISYVTFNDKLDIAMTVINTILAEYHYLNSTLLRRFATEAIINAITNIDMSLECSNGINGYDYMYYIEDGFDMIYDYIQQQYEQFMNIVAEQADDYNSGRIKVATNES